MGARGNDLLRGDENTAAVFGGFLVVTTALLLIQVIEWKCKITMRVRRLFSARSESTEVLPAIVISSPEEFTSRQEVYWIPHFYHYSQAEEVQLKSKTPRQVRFSDHDQLFIIDIDDSLIERDASWLERPD